MLCSTYLYKSLDLSFLHIQSACPVCLHQCVDCFAAIRCPNSCQSSNRIQIMSSGGWVRVCLHTRMPPNDVIIYYCDVMYHNHHTIEHTVCYLYFVSTHDQMANGIDFLFYIQYSFVQLITYYINVGKPAQIYKWMGAHLNHKIAYRVWLRYVYSGSCLRKYPAESHEPKNLPSTKRIFVLPQASHTDICEHKHR